MAIQINRNWRTKAIVSKNQLFLHVENNTIFRFIYLYILLLITGIGSWMFHMTLLYEMQLLGRSESTTIFRFRFRFYF